MQTLLSTLLASKGKVRLSFFDSSCHHSVIYAQLNLRPKDLFGGRLLRLAMNDFCGQGYGEIEFDGYIQLAMPAKCRNNMSIAEKFSKNEIYSQSRAGSISDLRVVFAPRLGHGM